MNDLMLGRHEEAIRNLAERVGGLEDHADSIEGKLDTILQHLAERRGERRMIALFATAMGGVGSFLMTIALKLWEHQP